MLTFIARLCSKKSWREPSALNLWNPGRCHSDVGIPIPKTLVIWASPVTLTIIAKIRWDGDAHISLWFWEWGCPKRGDAHIPLTAPSVLPNSPRGYATLPHIKHADVTISPATQAKMCHLVENTSSFHPTSRTTFIRLNTVLHAWYFTPIWRFSLFDLRWT